MNPPLPLARPATYDDLLALPDHVVGEIVGGELYVSPRPTPRHAVTSSVLGGELGRPDGWWMLDQPELHLGDDVVVPDLAGWRRVRMPTLPETAWFSVAPDWVCEVLSPGTARLDRHRKLDVYAKAGVGHCWLIDPLQRTLEVLQLDGPRWTLLGVHAGDEQVRVPPFAETVLSLGRLWAD